MGKRNLSLKDKETVFLFGSQHGIWFEKKARCFEPLSISLMSEEDVKYFIAYMKGNEKLFSSCKRREEIISNYTERFNERLEYLKNIEKIKKKHFTPKDPNLIELKLHPTEEEEKLLLKTCDAFNEIYNLFFDESLAYNTEHHEEKKYYNFFEEIKRIPILRKDPNYPILKGVDSIALKRAAYLVKIQWDMHWEKCKLQNEVKRDEVVPYPEKITKIFFQTEKIGDKNNVYFDGNYLKVPINTPIKATVVKDLHQEESEIKFVEVQQRFDGWHAFVHYKDVQ